MNFNNCFSCNLRLAQAYIPFQEMGKVYGLEKALYVGTLFPELNFPYESNDKDCFCKTDLEQEGL